MNMDDTNNWRDIASKIILCINNKSQQNDRHEKSEKIINATKETMEKSQDLNNLINTFLKQALEQINESDRLFIKSIGSKIGEIVTEHPKEVELKCDLEKVDEENIYINIRNFLVKINKNVALKIVHLGGVFLDD